MKKVSNKLVSFNRIDFLDMPSTLKIKKELIELIKAQEDVSVLKAIKTLLNISQNEFQPMSIEEFNTRIDKSMKDSKEGRLVSASNMKANIEKWS